MNRQELLIDLKRKEMAQATEPGHPIPQYYRIDYVASRLNLSPTMVRRLFQDHPATVFVGRTVGTSTKRPYSTMLIPESALLEFTAKHAS